VGRAFVLRINALGFLRKTFSLSVSVVDIGHADVPFFGRFALYWQVAARQPNLRWVIKVTLSQDWQ
jgi:hypothetical protein